MDVRDALAVVAEGRTYTKEHFQGHRDTTFVGPWLAETYDEAIDVLVAWVGAHIDGADYAD